MWQDGWAGDRQVPDVCMGTFRLRLENRTIRCQEILVECLEQKLLMSKVYLHDLKIVLLILI